MRGKFITRLEKEHFRSAYLDSAMLLHPMRQGTVILWTTWDWQYQRQILSWKRLINIPSTQCQQEGTDSLQQRNPAKMKLQLRYMNSHKTERVELLLKAFFRRSNNSQILKRVLHLCLHACLPPILPCDPQYCMQMIMILELGIKRRVTLGWHCWQQRTSRKNSLHHWISLQPHRSKGKRRRWKKGVSPVMLRNHDNMEEAADHLIGLQRSP
mmetsp:Transcript_48361/g.89685  ORF Transcript_48361/g.89685 Transcript_48361/m.89685 type:complete len:212 (-) Transcript_48361:1235-1870(-)